MRYFCALIVLIVTALPARAAETTITDSAWSVRIPRAVYTYPSNGRSDVDLVVPIGSSRTTSIRIETAIDAAPMRARIYLFEALLADCLVGEGAHICETPVVPVWDDQTPDPVPPRDIAVRVDTDADYVLTVLAYDSIPATAALFLPGVYRGY